MSTEPVPEKRLPKDADTIQILVATDIHLGYEYTKHRGFEESDTFDTFEEILQYAQHYKVDFILLGGDLFHDTKPTPSAIVKCMDLLRKYCMGTRPIKIKFLSDPSKVFEHCSNKKVNYEDPNMNICMPVFSIHGNHDDPSYGGYGSMDLLSVTGLVNYFGKWDELDKVSILPLVLEKGETCIALYGLSYMNDQRLHRLLRDNQVTFLQPEESTKDCFNIFVLHQNRAVHDANAYVPETKLPDFLDFVIWGHEHECRITPENISDQGYYISQPGSSVATSLSEGEAHTKHVGLLRINKNLFKMKKLRLKTVRPFVFDNVILSECNIESKGLLSEGVLKYVDNHIETNLMAKAAEQLTGHPKQPIKPLLRVRVYYTDRDELFHTTRLLQKYCEDVANPMDMVIFRKDKGPDHRARRQKGQNFTDDMEEMALVFDYDNNHQDWNQTVQFGIKRYFDLEENKDKLTTLTVTGLNAALDRFVDQDDGDAFFDLAMHQIEKTIDHLDEKISDEETTSVTIYDAIKTYRDGRSGKDEEEVLEISAMFNDERRKERRAEWDKSMAQVVDLDEDDEEPAATDGDDGNNASDVNRSETNEVDIGRAAVKTGIGRATKRGIGTRGGRGRAKSISSNTLGATTKSASDRGRTRRPTKKLDQPVVTQYLGPEDLKKKRFFFQSDSE